AGILRVRQQDLQPRVALGLAERAVGRRRRSLAVLLPGFGLGGFVVEGGFLVVRDRRLLRLARGADDHARQGGVLDRVGLGGAVGLVVGLVHDLGQGRLGRERQGERAGGGEGPQERGVSRGLHRAVLLERVRSAAAGRP